MEGGPDLCFFCPLRPQQPAISQGRLISPIKLAAFSTSEKKSWWFQKKKGSDIYKYLRAGEEDIKSLQSPEIKQNTQNSTTTEKQRQDLTHLTPCDTEKMFL